MTYLDTIKNKRQEKIESDKDNTLSNSLDSVSSDVQSLPEQINASLKSTPQDVTVTNIDLNKLSDAIQSISKVKGDRGEKGDKGEKGDRGEPGKIPKKGTDYFTKKEIKDISQDVMGRIRIPLDGKTPIKGVDYYTESEIQVILDKIIRRIPKPKDGKDGRDGLTTKIEYEKIVKDVVNRIPKPKDGRDGVNTFVTAPGKNPYATVGYGVVKTIVAGSNITIDSTDPINPIVSATAGSGITRTVTVSSGSFTAGSTASTDYVYLLAGAHVPTMPTAVGNTNRYTFKNNHSANITFLTTGGQTIDDGTLVLAPEESVDLISDNTNWNII